MIKISDTMKQWEALRHTGRGNMAQIKEFHRQHAKEIVKELDILNATPEGRAALDALQQRPARGSRAAEFFSMLKAHKLDVLQATPEGRAALREFDAGESCGAEEFFRLLKAHKRGEIPLEDVQAFYRRCEAEIVQEIQEGQDIVREHKEEA